MGLVVAQAISSNVFCVYLCLFLSVWLYVSLFLRVLEYWDCSFFFCLVGFVNVGGGEMNGIPGRAYALFEREAVG